MTLRSMPQHSLQLILAAVLFAAVPALPAAGFPKGTQRKAFTPELRADDYVWKPEASPAGPVVIIVSLAEQRLYVYRNGIRIGRATVSSGKPGHRTPTGVFTILEKNVTHHSTLYHGASMPYQERLTWGGVAIHAGGLPGYPESHGCIHVAMDFAQKLYTATSRGTTVIVTDDKAKSGLTSRPGLLLSREAGPALGAGEFSWHPAKAPTGPVSILFSSAEREAYVYRDGVEIGRAQIGGRLVGHGSFAYAALAKVNPDGSHDWQAMGSADGSNAPDLKTLAKTLVIPTEFLAQARAIVTPGTTLIITDQPVNGSTRSGPGFNILTTQK